MSACDKTKDAKVKSTLCWRYCIFVYIKSEAQPEIQLYCHLLELTVITRSRGGVCDKDHTKLTSQKGVTHSCGGISRVMAASSGAAQKQ